MRLSGLALPVALLLLAPVAPAQDEPEEASTYLEGDKVKVDDPPLRHTRPNDSLQYINNEKVKEQRRAQGLSNADYTNLRAHLWYGAARASVYVRCWKGAAPARGDKPANELLADSFQRELQGILRNSKLGKRKRVKVGKRPGIWFEIQGEAPDPRDRDKTITLTIMKVVAYRAEDKAILTVALEFSDPKRAKALAKDLKKLLKKVKF